MTNPNDYQIGGVHYRNTDIQHWDVMVELNVGYLPGCATKYITRYWKKNGHQDTLKARHFVEKYQSTRFIQVNYLAYEPQRTLVDQWLAQVVNDNRLAEDEKLAIRNAVCSVLSGRLISALEQIDKLIEYAAAGEPGARYVHQ